MTSNYLTIDAERDMEEISRYSIMTWGHDLACDYVNGLNIAFGRIGTGIIGHSIYNKLIPDLFVTKYRSHFIFYLLDDSQSPIILGVIHEQMDIHNLLKKRLMKFNRNS